MGKKGTQERAAGPYCEPRIVDKRNGKGGKHLYGEKDPTFLQEKSCLQKKFWGRMSVFQKEKKRETAHGKLPRKKLSLGEKRAAKEIRANIQGSGGEEITKNRRGGYIYLRGFW